MTAIITNVLTTVAPIIGNHWSAISPKQRISPTPAGTKKNPRFPTKKSEILSTQNTLTNLILRAPASNNMPIILEGMGMPVRYTINSPNAKKANRTAHCKIIT